MENARALRADRQQALERAVDLSRRQLALVRDRQLGAYSDGEQAQVAACRAVLDWPPAEMDDASRAMVGELTKLQRQLCAAFDDMMEAARMGTVLRPRWPGVHAAGARGQGSAARASAG